MRPLLLVTSLLALCSLFAAPAPAPASASTPAPVPTCDPELDDGGLFRDADVEGVFIVRDAQSDCTRTTDAKLADTGFRPQSTFKIPNSLIALELGVVRGETHPFKWSGKKYSVEDWNRDHDLASALRVSCVWCFQEIARDIGKTSMRRWLQDFRYGNARIDGPIDKFWLTGPLRITPRQQIDFVRRSVEGKLPISKAHVDLVWRILELERKGDSIWRGKTGLGPQDGRAIGWLVGYAEHRGRVYEYATLVRGKSATDYEMDRIAAVRKPITRALLVKLGALEPAS